MRRLTKAQKAENLRELLHEKPLWEMQSEFPHRAGPLESAALFFMAGASIHMALMVLSGAKVYLSVTPWWLL